jgi:hypothetical protein
VNCHYSYQQEQDYSPVADAVAAVAAGLLRENMMTDWTTQREQMSQLETHCDLIGTSSWIVADAAVENCA